ESILDVAIFFAGVLLLSNADEWAWIRFLFFLGLFWSSTNAGMLWHAPYPMLSQTLRSVVSVADLHDPEVNTLDLTWGIMNVIILMTLSGFLALVWWIANPRDWFMPPGWPILASIFCGAICLVAGLAWGYARGIYMKRCSGQYVKIITDYVDEFLKRWMV